MTEYTIDYDIPMPPKPPGNNTKYPWHNMEIGDSFVYVGRMSTVRSLISKRRKTTGHDYVYQVVEDTGNPWQEGADIRVWRVT